MDLEKKLSILSIAARYDNSCSSSGVKRETHPYGIGNTYLSGICHSWTSDGRCVSLLKILFTNMCNNSCKYCICRKESNTPRAIFTPKEIADLTLEFYKRNYIEGLFLSSGVYKTPDYTMELMLKAVEILRKEYFFGGYIHLKILPGTSYELIKKAFDLADRVSSNLELPCDESLKLLAPQKHFNELLKPLNVVRELYLQKERKSPASTQIIVGATKDTDKKILSLASSLYDKKLVRRVYYSAYIPINKDDETLPKIKKPPLLREHRLYQADWLLRFYNFSIDEIFLNSENLPLEVDPKLNWALNNSQFFPVEITRASYEELIRVPGIGPTGARRILKVRKYSSISENDLKKIGVSLKRAKFFITINGKRLTNLKETIVFGGNGQLNLFKDEDTWV